VQDPGQPLLLTVLTTVGAAHLVWLGLTMTAAKTSALAAGDADALSGSSSVRQAFTAFGVSGLNPKVLSLFLALFPRFTDPGGAWLVPMQIVALGVHVASCAVVYTAVAASARRVLRTRPTAASLVTRFSGAALIVIGAVLLIEPHLGCRPRRSTRDCDPHDAPPRPRATARLVPRRRHRRRR
jgi:threonine/homoserine/homoserine lactone efflux protein